MKEVVRSKTKKVKTPLLSDEVKKTFLFERYFWIFVKLFVEVVLILVVIILNFKSLYPNIGTKQKKFK